MLRQPGLLWLHCPPFPRPRRGHEKAACGAVTRSGFYLID